ncbi:protein Wiz isoform X5 [Poecilia latipinna]|uniref:protein Wiz isoform X5 n=1 Tax=Poecilia latipinna TaxID=48699 RepID=UPI00072EB042|nr:PREDICTED: protein Wiz-like isoform X5 [Poecilia latipinna]
MEPDGQPLTPGTSNGPLSYGSAQNPTAANFLSCSLESSCSPNLSDGLMTADCAWELDGEDDPERTAADPQMDAQRRFKSSAFPSSLNWDSDSEKEALDEEELQNFSNPHGLATHSPGSPSAGLRLDGEDDQEFEKLHSFSSMTDTSTPAEGGSDNNESTNKEEPNTSRLGQTESADNRVWSVSEVPEPFLSKIKPKQASPKEEEADSGEGETKPRGNEARELERDVYTFPGDSDPESPPPAPWAHCTFIQRCRRKRALLRPFSGIGSPETHKSKRLSPQTSKTDETVALSRAAEVYEFEDVSFDDGETKFRDDDGKEVKAEESGLDAGNKIFTCVECSIYFKKQVHLQEHMTEHCQISPGGGRRSGKGSRLRCAECGWNLPSRPALADHQRRHQESRLKILEEIEKLNENEKAKESDALESIAVRHGSADPTVAQYTGEMSDGDMGKSPPVSTASFSVQDSDPAVIDVDSVAPSSSSVRSPAAAHRRRFVCTECNFSTRTSQALANHSKIHKRKKQILHPHPSQKVLRERGKMSTKQDNEASQSLTSNAQILNLALDRCYLSECGSPPNAAPVTNQEDITASEDSTTSDRVADRRFRTAGKPCIDRSKFDPEADDVTLPGSEGEEQKCDLSDEPKPSLREASSPVGRKLHNTEESSPQHEATLSTPAKKSAKDQDKQEVPKDRKVFFLRRSSRVTVTQAQTDSDDDDDDTDEEHMRCFLSEGVFEKDADEIDEDSEALRSVERKCPYCPDRFHNGIGLANHVRGHLKRVGVSYNVRHFISPEEVNAIEKKFSYQKKKKKGDDKEAADEEDEEGLRLSSLDALCSSTGKKDSLSLREDVDGKVKKWKCEVCDSQFESRRGLSIHSRAHLRQLGFTVSESGGSAIELLHRVAMERSIDGKISSSLLSPKKPSLSVSLKAEEMEDMELDEKPIPLSILAKAAKAVPSGSTTPTPSPGASPAPAHSSSPSSVVKKAPISSLLPVSSPLRSQEHKVGGLKCLTSNLSAASGTTTSKPLWAPQENDAPLNLTLDMDSDKDIVCQLCGAWFETRKGLSSHARAHLRHFGVEYSESKGSPIELLSQLMDTDDFKHKASALELDSPTETQDVSPALPPAKQSLLTLSSSSSASLLYKVTTVGGGSKATSSSSSASSLPGPPAKRLKTSSMQVFRLSSGELMALPHNEPPKEIGCEYCGEYFENRKGLSSHARSHLRQMGITEWSVNGSPIDTLREIITRRGLPCALPLKPLKSPPPSSPGPPRSPLSPSSSPLLSRLPFAFARPSSPPQSVMSKSSSAPPMSPSSLAIKPKPEPVQVEVTAPGSVGRAGSFPVEPPSSNWGKSDKVYPLNLAMAHEVEPTRDIRCEFCGEYFENRKGLSSHARSHLRQMGITEWSVNGSPIDTLREVMHKRRSSSSSRLDQGVKKESRQGTNSPLWENAAGARGSDGLGVPGYQSSKFRKSPLSLVQSGSRMLKQGLGPMGPSASQPAGKLFRLSPLAKRPMSEKTQSAEAIASHAHRLKTFPSLPHDFSYKRKPSPEKHGHQDPSCELCGFYFENRKALASHARAHLRQFGVTEWSVNGSPIETLSAWIRSRPQKVLEMHRNYMQGNRSSLKKKTSSPLTSSVDSDHVLPISSQKAHSSSSSSSSQWSSSLASSLARPRSQELRQGSSEAADKESGAALRAAPARAGGSSPTFSRLGSSLQAQVARSELNVRLPRGFERRPLKHPSCPDGADRDSGSPKPPRTGTVPSLVPKPPSYPLVKLVGKFYTLKCRFCEVEFHGPLSVQEDWIRHLQQHIFKMNYNKPAALKAATADGHNPADNSTPVHASDPSSRTASTPTRSTAPNSRSPTPVAEFAPTVTAKEITQVSEEQPAIIPTPIPLPTQMV